MKEIERGEEREEIEEWREETKQRKRELQKEKNEKTKRRAAVLQLNQPSFVRERSATEKTKTRNAHGTVTYSIRDTERRLSGK